MSRATRAAIATALCVLALSAFAQSGARPTLRFVEVVEVKSRYAQVPCSECGEMPDLRFTGTTFKYRCDGELYENWTASPLQVGLKVQVAGCGNLVVTKDRKAVVKQQKNVEGE